MPLSDFWLFNRRHELDGCYAWFQACTLALLQTSLMGISISLGVLLEPLEQDDVLGNPKKTTLGLTRSLMMALIAIVGPFLGQLADKKWYGQKIVLLIGAIALLANQLITPTAQSTPAFLICYSSLMGLASAAVSCTAPSAVESWFSPKWISLAVLFGNVGVAVGTAVLPLLTAVILRAHPGDWRTGMRILSAVASVAVGCSLLIQKRDSSSGEEEEDEDGNGSGQEEPAADVRGGGTSLEKTIFLFTQHRPFLGIFFGQFCFAFSYFGVMLLFVDFSHSFGRSYSNITNSSANSALLRECCAYEDAEVISLERAGALMTFFGAFNAVGALALGYFASASASLLKHANKTILLVSFPVAGAVMFALVLCRAYWLLALLMSVLGVCCAGVLNALPSAVIEYFAVDSNFGVTFVMSLSFVGFSAGGVAGPPALAAMVASDGSYTVPWVVAGVVWCLGSVAIGGLCRELPPPSAPSSPAVRGEAERAEREERRPILNSTASDQKRQEADAGLLANQ